MGRVSSTRSALAHAVSGPGAEDVRELLTAAGLAAVSGLVYVVYRYANPFLGAEHYYLRQDRRLYAVMKVCYFVIIVSLALNARFLVSWVLRIVLRGVAFRFTARARATPRGRART